MNHQASDIFKALRKSLSVFDTGNVKKGKEIKAIEKISSSATNLKHVLTGDLHPETEIAISTGFNEFIVPLINNLHKLDFEARKDISAAFCRLVRVQVAGRSPTCEFIIGNIVILDNLFSGYDNTIISLNCGTMIRGCIEREEVARLVLNSDIFYKLFAYIESPSFDVATDAFATLKDLLTKHKLITAEFLDRNYDQVMSKYTNLLNSENYVTKRQSLKLLGELLLDKVNFNVMTKYISYSRNLKLMMTLLCDESRSIQFESFHVFKIFVANPHKPEAILKNIKKK